MTCDMDIQNIYNSIAELSREIVRECTARSVKISTAESCTGGMISGAVTSISGSSAVIELGVCSYSNRIKHEILHVPAEVLEQFTEYSVECAAEMAKGVMELSGADYGVSTTGVAGPTGGSAECRYRTAQTRADGPSGGAQRGTPGRGGLHSGQRKKQLPQRALPLCTGQRRPGAYPRACGGKGAFNAALRDKEIIWGEY